MQVLQCMNTVYIGLCDHPPSRGSRSLKPMEVAILSGFPLGIATRRSLKAILVQPRLSPLGITTSTVAISLFKTQNLRSLNTRSLYSTKKGPSWSFWSLNTDWPLYPWSQNPMLTVLRLNKPSQYMFAQIII